MFDNIVPNQSFFNSILRLIYFFVISFLNSDVFGIYGTVLDEKWHHFALTWKPYCLHVYLDGHETMFDEVSDNFDVRPIFNQYHDRFVFGRYDGNGTVKVYLFIKKNRQ